MRLSAMVIQSILLVSPMVAQAPPPNLPPGMTLPPGFKIPTPDSRRRPSKRADNDAVKPPGVPVPLDSAPMKSFQLLEQHPVYHMRMTMTAPTPEMQQMMDQMGFAPMETTVNGGTKQVIMRMKIPASDIPGQVDEWEFKSVSQNGRAAKLFSSPAVPRLQKLNDAQFAKALADIEKAGARTIAQSMLQGPIGWARAGMMAAETAAYTAMTLDMQKKAHDFYKWQCMAVPAKQEVDRTGPPPLTDLQVTGDQTLDGVSVTAYAFYVQDKDQFHGPMKMFVAKDSGLPVRIEMTDARMRGASMKMDYYDFDKGGDFEVPACLAEGK